MNDPIRARRLALIEDKEPIKYIPEGFGSSWKSSRLVKSKSDTARISYQVCISIICVLHQLILVKFSHDIVPPSTGPLDLSFVVKVDEILPNFEKTPPLPEFNVQGLFLPPKQRNSYDSGSGRYFRFKHGCFDALGPDPVEKKLHVSALALYSAATVFSQAPHTDHLLLVRFDARLEDVSVWNEWTSLTFDYKEKNSSSSYASLIGDQYELSAPIPPEWNNLIPQPYRYQKKIDAEGRIVQPNTKFAGLIGNLPLLVALAAFSAPRDNLDEVLKNHIRGGRWIPHNYNTGRQSLCLLYHQIYR